MPSNYAHYRLGKLLLPDMPSDVQQCIGRFRRMYDMGLQGPDIFYYHNPFVDTAAGRLGEAFHQKTGKEFFEKACKAASSEAGRAYLYGLLAHYCLDAVSHPFIERKVAAGEGRHTPMEKEFDRYLMALDGLTSPHTKPLGDKVRLTRGECVTVAAFYPPATPSQVNSAVKFMSFGLNFLAKHRKGLLYGMVKGLYPSLVEHAVPEEVTEGSERINSELLARFNWVLRDYPKYLAALEGYRKNGEELSDLFDPIFG